MNFSPPSDQQQLDELQAICRFTEFGPGQTAAIDNAWRVHVNPRADGCSGAGCSQTMERHRTIVVIASQRMSQWQDALAAKAVEEFKADSMPETSAGPKKPKKPKAE